MKIVKSFEDFKFFNKVYEGPNDPEQEFWKWGLGEDGDLYCQCSDFTDILKWYRYDMLTGISSKVSLRDMRRIVKEFGHLVVFT